MGEIIFKTELIKGAKGDRGEAGQADSIPTDGVIAFQGETVPDGYEETDPGDVFDEVYEDINAVKDMISDEYDTTTTYNAGDFCIHENALYKCTATATGLWDNSKWVLTSASDETKTNAAAIDATQDMIGDVYDSTHTYNVGDYCIHENALYKCKTASTTGTWDPSKWDSITVANEILALKSKEWKFYTGVLTSDDAYGVITIPDASIAFVVLADFAVTGFHLQYSSGATYVLRNDAGYAQLGKTVTVIALYQ